MKTLATIVSDLDRLSFAGTAEIVGPFIQKRHSHFGIKDVAFSPTGGDATLSISAFNPLTDFDAVRAGVALTESGALSVSHSGAIPGTNFNRIEVEAGHGAATVFSDTQLRFNNQFNLRKVKRHKMFRILSEREPDLWKFDVEEIVAAVKRQHIHLALYGVSADHTVENSCPSCGSSDRASLYGRTSQPVIGYVSPDITLYFECGACGLGYMSPRVSSDRVAEIYDDFDSADGALPVEKIAKTPVSRKHRAALDLVSKLIPASAKILDLGGGSGRFSIHAKQDRPAWTVVHSDFEARQNQHLTSRGIETRAINIVSDQIGSNEFDLITAFEVVEHLDFASFKGLLDKVKSALKPNGCFLLTTPDLDSPLIRAFDFFNAYAPHHMLIFSKSWMRHFIAKSSDFEILEMASAADLLDNNAAYFDYYAETSPTEQLRSAAKLLKPLLSDGVNRAALLARGHGSEFIAILKVKK